MPPQHPPDFDRHADVQPSPKNVFDREPLLIPKRPGDRPRPWFRRKAVLTSILLVVAVAVAIGAGFGATVAEAFAGLAAR